MMKPVEAKKESKKYIFRKGETNKATGSEH